MIQSPPALLNLSDLSGRIDIQGFYESHGCVVAGKPTNSNEGYEWPSSCPRCPGSTDGFSFWSSGRFSHSLRSKGCGWHESSPYYFLRDEGYSHFQALEELGIDPDEVDSYSPAPLVLPLAMIKDEPPCKKWQEAAGGFVRACEYILWSSQGESARNYLHRRGFTDATIKAAHLGLCADWYIKPLEDWGLSPEQLMKEDDPQIKIPRGITIPWFVDGNIHKIQLRRPEPGPTGKYFFEVTGSSDCLYNVDCLLEDKPVMLVESELDALSVAQEAGDIIAVVATGGSGKALSGRPIARLSRVSFLLQSFDDDEAGERGAEHWLDAFDRSERWTPLAHDCNDMLKEGISIRSWVEQGLQMIAEQGKAITITYVDDSTEIVHLPTTPPAVDRAGNPIPADLIARYPDIVERVLAFQDAAHACKKICCDTLDWAIDWDGLLVCPCVIRRREENRLLDLRIEQEERARKRKYGLIG